MRYSRVPTVFALLFPLLLFAQSSMTPLQKPTGAKSSSLSSPSSVPPFDKLELFAFLAAGPFPPYAAEAIQKRGLDFVPNDPFLLSDPFDPIRDALARVKPVKGKPMSAKRAEAFTHFSEAANSIRNQQCTLAEPELYAAMRLAPESSTIHFSAAACQMFSHNWPAAEKEMRESLRLWPGNADAHALLAYVLSNQGRTEETIPEAREALRIFPGHQGAVMLLGMSLARVGRYAEAIPILQQSAVLNKKVTYVEKMLGFSYLSNKQPAEAVEPLDQYIEADPEDAEAHFLLGTALRQLGRDDEARTQFSEAARLDPQNQTYQSVARPTENR